MTTVHEGQTPTSKITELGLKKIAVSIKSYSCYLKAMDTKIQKFASSITDLALFLKKLDLKNY